MSEITAIGRRFRAALAMRGLSVKAAIEKSGEATSEPRISTAIRTANPHISTVIGLARVAQTSVGYLLGETDCLDRTWPTGPAI